jgi:hypothetical protein
MACLQHEGHKEHEAHKEVSSELRSLKESFVAFVVKSRRSFTGTGALCASVVKSK